MRKKLLLLFLTIVSVACLAFGVTACGGGSSSTKGTYYLYKNGSYDYTSYITLSGSSWEDDDGETGTYKISGTSITFYYELLGETEELMNGTISDGVMTLNIMGATYTYCLEGKAPSSSGTDDGGTSTTYTVTYNANGGTFTDGSETYTQTVNSGSTLTAPTSPTRDGCTFAGWATSKNGSTMWQFGSDKVTSNTTLYASWSEQSASILSVDGASINGTEISMLVDHNTDSVSLSTKVVCSSDSTWKLYYDKLGQTEIPTKIAASTAGSLYNGDNVFYIVVTSTDGTQVNVYTLTIYRSYAVYVTYYDGTTAIKTETAYTGYSFTTTYTPDISGYTFNYWKTSSGSKFTETTLTSALSLYADKTANDYTITYDVNGGDELASTTKTVAYDSSYTLAVPERTGYSFNGWYYGSTQLTDEDGKSIEVWSYASDTTVTAKWTANDYTVTLNLSNSSAGTVTGDGDHAYDSSVTIKATTNNGYTWLGWYDSDCELVSTNASYTFTMGFDVSYTAKWTYYTFTTHVSDSAAGSVSNYLNLDVKVTVGTSITIKATTNSGYTWVGWYTEDDELVTSDLSYTFKMPAKDLEYTAKWMTSTVTVTSSDTSIGTVSGLTTSNNILGNSITVKATSVNLGYNWLGWYNGETKLTDEYSYTFTITETNADYVAMYELDSAMSNFEFTSTATTCSITGIKSYTITEIVVPDYVTSISVGAFKGCSKLESITLPFIGTTKSNTSDTYSYNSIFAVIFGYTTATDTYSNETVTIASVSGTYNLYATLVKTGSYTSGNYTHKYYLYQRYFYYVPTTLKNVTITGGKIKDGEFAGTNSFSYNGAFSGCTMLQNIKVNCDDTSIGNYAFYGCTSLESITIGDSVTSIGGGAFYNCTGLTSITIPDSVTSIGYDAFYKCTSLTIITVPDSVTSIGSSAFSSCTSLTNITIPDSVTSIGSYAFGGCTSLTSITIPNSVTSIDTSAFSGCTSLTSVYYSGTSDEWSAISISSNNTYLTNATLYYYSEEEPDYTGGYNYWHYVDGEIVVWEQSTEE